MLGIPPVSGYNTSVGPGSQGARDQAEMMFPPSAGFDSSREALAAEEKVSPAALEGFQSSKSCSKFREQNKRQLGETSETESGILARGRAAKKADPRERPRRRQWTP